jgi:hypothetical protein
LITSVSAEVIVTPSQPDSRQNTWPGQIGDPVATAPLPGLQATGSARQRLLALRLPVTR